MAKKGKKKSGGIRKAIRAAGPNISRQEMKTITQAAGGNVRKAVNQIAKVQQSQRQADKPTTTVASGAANMLIRQAAKAPATRYDPKGTFGTSKLGQTLQSMVGTPDLRQRNPQGGFYGGASTATPMQLVDPGMAIRASGRVGTRRTVVPEPQVKETIHYAPHGDPSKATLPQNQPTAGADDGSGEPELDPNQAWWRDQLSIRDQQIADLSNQYNSNLLAIQQGYQDQVALGIEQQKQQEAEDRAYLMNQFRMGTRPDFRGVQTYNPQLAGTQGFKFRQPQPTLTTPAQVATAFTTPTTATTTPVNQVLNI